MWASTRAENPSVGRGMSNAFGFNALMLHSMISGLIKFVALTCYFPVARVGLLL